MTEKVELDNSIFITETKASDELCDGIIELFNNRKKNEPSTIVKSAGHGYHTLDRKDSATYLEEVGEFDVLRDFGAVPLANQVNAYLDDSVAEYYELYESLKAINLRSVRQKIQYTPKGGGYHIWHYEQMDLTTSDRILVWTIYLNDVEEGGETEFLYQSKRIKAKKGNICIFPAQFNYTHRGNPPLSGDKYIITGWWTLY